MTRRSPARLLAPLALVAVAAALFFVLDGRGGDAAPTGAEPETGRTTRSSGTAEATPTPTPSRSGEPRTYRVRAGDTPSQIADETGVPLARLEELNPDLDAQSLTVGQRLKLR